ncbi:MAG: protein-disulfide reductase DsbD N-terminal domain-containing protein [Acidobacteriota bacterium]|nr:protein-disulfide reductase DsbD N-terminal domain-containing protein [Acidobacteriota bacterium]
MTPRIVLAAVVAAVVAAPLAQPAHAQPAQAQLDTPPKKAYVTYSAEPQTVAAARSAVLELRFHVNPGYHVNSHTPKSEMLIPTVLTLDPADGVKTGALHYPAGTMYSFSFDPKEKLDVYAGDFTVKLPVTASAGQHTLSGSLHYQACDNAACYPPRSLPVQVVFTAK